MRHFFFILLITILPVTCLANSILFYNVNGYSLDQNNKLAKFTAMHIVDDKISQLFVEPSEYVELYQSAAINKIDGKGKSLLPGLIDAHGHVLSYGLSLSSVDLTGSQSELNAVNRVVAYAKENTGLVWLQGRGWNQVQWQNKQFPAAKSLDKHFPDRPVWLKRVDGHAGWANAKAMAIAGINKQTKAPDGGEIVKDASGNPTGVFIDNAMSLIDNKIAPLTKEELKQTLILSMNSLASMGLTSVHDAGILQDNLQAYKELAQEKKMAIRINAMIDVTDKHWLEILAKGTYRSIDDMFAYHSVKVSSDGALGSRGASLIEDYSDSPGNKGLLLHNEAALEKIINDAMRSNFQVNTHAIGDNANNLLLNLYQKLIKETKSKHLRHRIEHAQVLQLTDIPRFKTLDIIASMQATHATSDKNMAQDRLGEQRIIGAYAWRTLLNNQITIAAGSDFPVESPNPFYGLHASVTRQDHKNQPENGWFADQKMTRLEAFKSFTLDAAFAGHQEHIIGSLMPGKKADFIIIEEDFFTQTESEMWKNMVLETWVNGKQVYKKDDL